MLDPLWSYFIPSSSSSSSLSPSHPKATAKPSQQPLLPQYRTLLHRLLVRFVAWKVLLLLVAALSPGVGYDSSTAIFFDTHGSPPPPLPQNVLFRFIHHLVLRLTRWDGIYFASIAERGYVYEQQWAFGGAWGRTPALFARALSFLPLSPIVTHALVACVISHVFHLLAVLTLFRLTADLIPVGSQQRQSIAFTAACLHIVSPAGIFLSAPYNESACAFWSFAGAAVYVAATRRSLSQPGSSSYSIQSGLLWGITAATRSNGLLQGIIPAWDLLALLPKPWTTTTKIRSLVRIIVSGSLIALGLVLPQIAAYTHYCTNTHTRPWCSAFPPSIYHWVQHHYWNVGLFRYWTPNNIPLFLLASPMLCMLISTAFIAFQSPSRLASLVGLSNPEDVRVFNHCLPRLAAPQLLLAVLAACSFHVQIVNRLSSAYPVWYILLAVAVHAPLRTTEESKEKEKEKEGQVLGWFRRGSRAQWVVRAMVVYAVVQAGLFAAFLPPA